MRPRAEDTYYWHSLTEKERAGEKGRDFKAFYKEWTKGTTSKRCGWATVLHTLQSFSSRTRRG